jgi:protein O-mannosyl-transferase
VLLVSTFIVLRLAARRPYLWFGWLWYLGTLVPVIGIVQVGAQGMADRYTYVPLVGLFIMVSWSLPEIAKKHGADGGETRKGRDGSKSPILPLSVCAVIVVLAACAHRQVGYWRDDATLLRRALSVTRNNSIAHNNLGEALVWASDLAGGIPHFREAIRISPRFADARFNLAHALVLRGSYQEAVEQYRKGLETARSDSTAISELGVAYSRLGRVADAVACYRRAVILNPGDQASRYRLGQALLVSGDAAGAADQLSKAVELRPDWPEAHYNLSAALLMQGKTDVAISHLRSAIELRPDYALAHRQLASALFLAGDYAHAWDEVRLARQFGCPPGLPFVRQLSLKMPEPPR